MSFNQYQEEIEKTICNCSDEKLDRFCHDVITRMQSFINLEDVNDLSEDETGVLKNLREGIKNYPIDWMETAKYLDYFTEIAEQDQYDNFREFDSDFIEFLSAIDSWRIFHETGSKEAVCAVSEHLMNRLDSIFVTEMNIEKWLTVPEINAEFNKQMLFLKSNL